MDSTSSDLYSVTGSIADSDLRDMDLVLAAVTAPTQASRSSSWSARSVEEPPAIDVSRAPTMDNVIPVVLCALFCAHAPSLTSASNHCS